VGFETSGIAADPQKALAVAARAIAQGQLVVIPTDTVYGIAADALDPAAVSGLLAAKGRGRDMPPPVMVAEPAMLESVAHRVAPAAQALAKAYWPGALTLVVRAHPSLNMDLGDRGATIAVRVPDHDFVRELLRITGPLAVSSANVSGEPAAASVQAAIDQLGDSVAVYLDGGSSTGSAVSTIVQILDDEDAQVKILRQGAISEADIFAVALKAELAGGRG
jgi:tRNA threonylcarbamoyl adenosine modification protein (Sua5/YciO/YrdC/YwlC family)